MKPRTPKRQFAVRFEEKDALEILRLSEVIDKEPLTPTETLRKLAKAGMEHFQEKYSPT